MTSLRVEPDVELQGGETATGGEPRWLGPYQLIYADFDENRNSTTRQYDLISETTTILDLPTGSIVLLTP